MLIASKSRKILVTNGHCLEIYLQENESKKYSPGKLEPNSATAVIKDTEVRSLISDFYLVQTDHLDNPSLYSNQFTKHFITYSVDKWIPMFRQFA